VSADIFAAIGAFMAKNPDMAGKIGKIFQFRLKSPDSVWTLDVKNAGNQDAISQGETAAPDCTLELTDSDFMDMCTGKADPQKLYFGGKLKISGDIMASQKLTFLQKIEPQMVLDAMRARAGQGGGAAPAAAQDTATAEPQSGDVFLGIKAYVAEHPELVDKAKTVFLFKLSDPDSAWTLDLKSGKGEVKPGTVDKADCTLEMSDADFMAMSSGQVDPQKLYFGGKLKIAGDIMASQKLTFLQKIDPAWARKKVAELKAQGVSTTASTGASPGASPGAFTTASAPPPSAARAPAIFAALEARLAENPDLAREIDAVVQFEIKDPDALFTVEAREGKARASQGGALSPTATLTLSDQDLDSLVRGEIGAQELYQRGRMRVDGDVRVAHRLGYLNNLL
jgi:3-hydroxyacyl-CoA dehydrogenase/3a,7a,12a-trihydroxy-5b-cholest-24-enoyl-CoA hydratase